MIGYDIASVQYFGKNTSVLEENIRRCKPHWPISENYKNHAAMLDEWDYKVMKTLLKPGGRMPNFGWRSFVAKLYRLT